VPDYRSRLFIAEYIPGSRLHLAVDPDWSTRSTIYYVLTTPMMNGIMETPSKARRDHDDDDLEAQQQHEMERNQVTTGSTDDHFLDGMNVEDWLAKHQEIIAEHSAIAARNESMQIPPVAAASLGGRLQNTEETNTDSTINSGVKNVKDSSSKHRNETAGRSLSTNTAIRSCNAAAGSALRLTVSEANESLSTAIHLIGEAPATIPDDDWADEVIDANIRVVGSSSNTANDFYVAELLPPRDDNILLIEGVKPADSKTRRVCSVVGFLVLLSIISVVAAKITTWISSSSASNRSPTPGDLQEGGGDPIGGNSTLSPHASPQFLGNLSWTFADAIAHSENEGSIVGWYVSTINGKIYLDLINRTDINFTIFGISDNVNIFGWEFSSLLTKIVTPLWYGHFVSVLNGIVGAMYEY
jgi:hypothetical protein